MMINNFLIRQIKEFFQYEPTSEQEKAIDLLSEFFVDRRDHTVFVLKGYAGTGKTSLVGALVKALDAWKRKSTTQIGRASCRERV